MINETFYSDEFVTSQILNQDVQNNVNNFQSLTLGRGLPGLISPTAVTYSVSGLNVGMTLPAPFQILFGTGILAGAHGTINGNDTQSYTASFSGVVPAPGFPATTAYLVCTYAQIQQSPIIFIGPPPGHPDYNPNYQPVTQYTQTVDSINIFATVSPPDNSTSFELFRCTLASGATGLGTTSTAFQEWASSLSTLPVNILAAPTTLETQAMNNILVGGTYTLPNASTFNSNVLGVTCNTAQLVTIQSSTNNIYGYFGQAASPITILALPQGGSIELEAINGTWQIIGGNPLGMGIPTTVYPFTVPEGGTGVEFFTQNAVVIGEGASPLSTVGPGAFGIPFLGGGGGAPFFGALNLDSGAVTSTLQIANGGTNQTSYVPFGAIVLNSNTGQFWGVAPGAAGGVLTSNGSSSLPSFQPSGGLINVRTYSSAGTYTYSPTPNAVTAVVEFVGAGGGGGGTPVCTGIEWSGGGGGGAGGVVRWYGAVSSISGQSITIGAGGSGGYNSGSGAPGGATTFNGIGSANGGGGGSGGSANDGSATQFGGAGGGASGGFLSADGGCGNVSIGTDQLNFCAGCGGVSHFSGGPLGIIDGTANGGNGIAGAGGSGSGTAADSNGGGATQGGSGGDGFCVIYEYA